MKTSDHVLEPVMSTHEAAALAPATIKALMYDDLDRKSWDEKELPLFKDPTDTLVRVTTTTICGRISIS